VLVFKSNKFVNALKFFSCLVLTKLYSWEIFSSCESCLVCDLSNFGFWLVLSVKGNIFIIITIDKSALFIKLSYFLVVHVVKPFFFVIGGSE